jgi:YegS/Rv2252/BmrU family lipid kinase
MDEHFKTFAVVNPHSANGRTGKKWPQLADLIRHEIGTFDFALTSRPMEAPDITREALGKGYEMVVSVGGDGNNNEIINGFFDGDKPINPDAAFAVVPGGTGGDLARILGVRGIPMEDVVKTLRGRDATRSDAGRVMNTGLDGKPQKRYYINIADLGIGGEAIVVVNKTTKALGGFMSFLIGSTRATLAYHNRYVKYRVDDGPEEEGRFYLITAALGQYFGGGMQVAPLSVHNDGLFDIMVLGDMSFMENVKLGTKIYTGKHLSMSKVKRLQGKKLYAESNEKVFIDIDGEEGGILPATFEILPGAVRMKQL